MLYKAYDPVIMPKRDTPSMQPLRMPIAPPYIRNYSDGALYAIAAKADIDTPVARAASATTAILDI